jgi:hypothetical protein
MPAVIPKIPDLVFFGRDPSGRPSGLNSDFRSEFGKTDEMPIG